MKLLNLSLLLILMSFALLLSTAGESAETKSPAEGQKQSKPADSQTAESKNATQATPPISLYVTVNNPAPTIEEKSPAREPQKWPPLWTIFGGLIIGLGEIGR